MPAMGSRPCAAYAGRGIAGADVMAGLTIFGIRNCGTMKKARAWLEAHGVEYRFHDYKTAGIDAATLRG